MQGMVAYDPTIEWMLSADIRRALWQLTPEQRLALELAVADYGVRSMAQELHLTVAETRALLESAIARMRELLDGWEYAERTAE